MGKLDARNGYSRGGKRLEAGHGGASALDCAMVLLNDVVEVAVGSDQNIAPAGVLAPLRARGAGNYPERRMQIRYKLLFLLVPGRGLEFEM